PGLFGVEQLAVTLNRGIALHLAVVDDFNLFARAVQVASKSQQLEQKQPAAVIGRLVLDFLKLGLNGLLQAAGFEKVVGGHEMSLDWGKRKRKKGLMRVHEPLVYR